MKKIITVIFVLLFATRAVAADWQVLLTPHALDALETDVTVIDIRAPSQFEAGHLEGALNAPYASWSGPRENPGAVPSDADLTARLQSLGLSVETPVVVNYAGTSQIGFGAAARVYWTLKSAGLTRIAILNGGHAAWERAGLPVTTAAVAASPSDDQFALSDRWRISTNEILDVVNGKARAQIIDARPYEFLEGMNQHDAALEAGTIAGAANIEQSIWFTPEAPGALHISSPRQAANVARQAGVELAARLTLASFCDTGRLSATNWFVLSELAGIDGVKLYPESMVGWTRAGLETVVLE